MLQEGVRTMAPTIGVTSFWKTQLEAGNVMLGRLSNDEGKEVVELMMVLDITPM